MSANKIPVIIIDKETENIDKVSGLLKNVPDVEIIQTSTNLKDLEIILKDKINSILFLGPIYQLDDVEKLLKSFSAELFSVKIILLVKEISANVLKRAIKLNVHDVLEFPFAYNDIEDSIKRADETFKEIIAEKETGKKPAEEPQETGSRKVMIFSTKGGCGKTFIASNLAVDIFRQNKKGVVLFDLNYQFGDAALMLNLYPKHTANDIISLIDKLDTEMMSSFLTTHSSGVKVLPVPVEPSQGENISTRDTLKIMDILSKISDYIVIDAPSVFSDTVLSLLDKTYCLCMIASMDVPSIKNLKVSLQVLSQLRFPPENIFVVLNRADSKVGISVGEIESTIKRKIDVAIPSDRIVPMTVNKGVPVIVEAPRSSVSKSIHKLTKLVMLPKEKRPKHVLKQ